MAITLKSSSCGEFVQKHRHHDAFIRRVNIAKVCSLHNIILLIYRGPCDYQYITTRVVVLAIS